MTRMPECAGRAERRKARPLPPGRVCETKPNANSQAAGSRQQAVRRWSMQNKAKPGRDGASGEKGNVACAPVSPASGTCETKPISGRRQGPRLVSARAGSGLATGTPPGVTTSEVGVRNKANRSAAYVVEQSQSGFIQLLRAPGCRSSLLGRIEPRGQAFLSLGGDGEGSAAADVVEQADRHHVHQQTGAAVTDER